MNISLSVVGGMTLAMLTASLLTLVLERYISSRLAWWIAAMASPMTLYLFAQGIVRQDWIPGASLVLAVVVTSGVFVLVTGGAVGLSFLLKRHT